MKSKIEYYIKHNRILQIIYKFIFSSALKFIGFFIKIDDSIVLFTGHGGKYNDSPKYIYEKLMENPRYKDLKLVWGLSNVSHVNENVHEFVKIDTFKYFLVSLKAKYWIASVNIERGLNYKKKKTLYLNTWHGIPIKKIGNSANARADYDFSNIDYFVVSSEYEKPIYIRDFKVKEHSLVKTGMPRNQMLFKEKDERLSLKIKNELGLPVDKKIILYAPTWRDSDDKGKSYSVKPPIDFEYWRKELSDDYIVLVRAHPYTTNFIDKIDQLFVYDVSNYDEINSLIFISDLLISDYSAIFFDYSITKKPIYCFAYDLEEYKNNRGVYIDLETSFPGGVITDEIELIRRIKCADNSELLLKIEKFRDRYIEVGENSIQDCINIIFKELKEE